MVSKVIFSNNNFSFNLHNIEKSESFSIIFEKAVTKVIYNLQNKNELVFRICKFLKKIDFILVEEKELAPFSYTDGNLLINLNSLDTFEVKINDSYETITFFEDVIIHELIHIYHNKKSNYIEKFKNRKNKLKSKLNLNFFKWFIPISLNNGRRTKLFDFINGIYLEGLATYIQYLGKGFLLKESHELSKKYLINLKSEFLNYNENDLEFEEDKTQRYVIGHYMVNVIMYENIHNLSFDDLIKINFKKFIEYYEESIIQLNLEVLISYSSGKGLFDYQELIKEWKKSKRNK